MRLGEWVSFRINSFYLHKVSFRIKSIVFRNDLAHTQNAIALNIIEKSIKSFNISVLVVYSLSEVRCVREAQNIAAMNWYVTVVSRLSHISLRRLQPRAARSAARARPAAGAGTEMPAGGWARRRRVPACVRGLTFLTGT